MVKRYNTAVMKAITLLVAIVGDSALMASGPAMTHIVKVTPYRDSTNCIILSQSQSIIAFEVHC